MAEITAGMVKELRDKSGAGMMDCKQALKENDGDMKAAVDWLRTKGIATAEKKAGRTAAEGLVGAVTDGKAGALVEINSETDFVARNEQFQAMVIQVARLGLDADSNVETLKGMDYPGTGKSVVDHVTDLVGTIGENMSVRRTAVLTVDSGTVASYVHNRVSDGLGKIGVIVALESDGDVDKLAEIGKQVAMHVTAASPLAVTRDDLDAGVVEHERNILAGQARESGKPEAVVEKMIEGRMRKFYEEVVLLSQTFAMDGENTVEQVLKNAEADVGGTIVVKGFVRYALGEGIERDETDFASEVAAAASV